MGDSDDEHGVSDRYQRRAGVGLLLVVLLVLASLGGRLVYIQMEMAPHLTVLLERQQTGRLVVPARRGMIFDRRGRILAGTESAPSVFADPALIHDLAGESVRVAAVLDMPAGQVEDLVRNARAPRFCWIKRRVSPAEAAAVRGLKLAGFGTAHESSRCYPLGTSLAQVLGFVDREGAGLAGLELVYDAHLRGHDGRIGSIRDVRRRAIWRRQEDTLPVTDGGHILLTIDSVIQGIVERALGDRVRAAEAESGVALVLSPRTGEVLALACYPAFDPADPTAVAPEVRRNRVVVDPVEPGSTIKPVIASSALAGGFVNTTEKLFCHQGVYTVTGRTLHDTKPHGDLTLEDIVVHSSNIGMALVGQRMGNAVLYEALRQFGFGEPTGIELPGESPGLLRPLRRWGKMTTTSVPMGYEVGVTPLQLAVAYTAIVNGGVLLRPRLVRALMSPDGTPLELYDQPQPVRRVLPERVARYFTEDVLVRVVNRDGKTPPPGEYTMAGKTGTAKLTRPGERGYVPGWYLSSFVGAAPSEDPRVVVVVMIRKPNPERGYYGRTVAMPAVTHIVRETLAYLDAQDGPGPFLEGDTASLPEEATASLVADYP